MKHATGEPLSLFFSSHLRNMNAIKQEHAEPPPYNKDNLINAHEGIFGKGSIRPLRGGRLTWANLDHSLFNDTRYKKLRLVMGKLMTDRDKHAELYRVVYMLRDNHTNPRDVRIWHYLDTFDDVDVDVDMIELLDSSDDDDDDVKEVVPHESSHHPKPIEIGSDSDEDDNEDKENQVSEMQELKNKVKTLEDAVEKLKSAGSNNNSINSKSERKTAAASAAYMPDTAAAEEARNGKMFF